MKNILLLGATGSIGSQTLDVIRAHPDRFRLISAAAGNNIEALKKIIGEFKPQFVSTESKQAALDLKSQYPDIEFGFGTEGLKQAAVYESNNQNENLVVTAVVGSIGLLPTLEAINKGYHIALANKETLITAGDLVIEAVNRKKVNLLPVDSEHAAIFQCLMGENKSAVKRLIITASGGAFRNKNREELKTVTVLDALQHPNWSMGNKITIDSATMMNKGFEVIEAHHLFSVPYNQIDTLLHQESIVHSMVEFHDHAIIAQLGTPDMRIPIQFAMNYPERLENNYKGLDWQTIHELHFKPMDLNRYPCLKYAYEAGNTGHTLPVVLNAANEAAVSLFLKGKISFLDIESIIYDELANHRVIYKPDLETILTLDQEVKTRVLTSKGATS